MSPLEKTVWTILVAGIAALVFVWTGLLDRVIASSGLKRAPRQTPRA